MKEYFEKLLKKEIVTKHYTYNDTGIICGKLKKISGSAGIDVDNFYYDPRYNKIVVCTSNNTQYGNAHINSDGYVQDNSNRSIFKIV